MNVKELFPVGSKVEFTAQGLKYLSNYHVNKIDVISDNYRVIGYNKSALTNCEENYKYCDCVYTIKLYGIEERFLIEEIKLID